MLNLLIPLLKKVKTGTWRCPVTCPQSQAARSRGLSQLLPGTTACSLSLTFPISKMGVRIDLPLRMTELTQVAHSTVTGIACT